MAKITLTDVGSGYDLTPLNTNFTSLEDELQNKVLYRNNPTGEPNQMENDLDMNNNNILNVNLVNGEDLSNLSGNLTTVANLDTEITTVAGISAEVQTVAGDSTAINNISASLSDVQTVSTNISDVNTVATNISDLQTVATNVTAVTNVSDNINDVNSFAQLYLGSKTSDPTLDNDGNALVDGALYFNTTANGGNGELRIYDLTGTTWKVAAFSATAANGVTYNNGTSELTATEVQSAIDEVDGNLDSHIASGTAHAAADVTYDNSSFNTRYTPPTNVEEALNKVSTMADRVGTTIYTIWSNDGSPTPFPDDFIADLRDKYFTTLFFSGTAASADIEVYFDTYTTRYVFNRLSDGYNIVIKNPDTGPGTGVTIPANARRLVVWDPEIDDFIGITV